jgi:hypothetical protein
MDLVRQTSKFQRFGVVQSTTKESVIASAKVVFENPVQAGQIREP